jgi:hypothetical protein
MAESIIERLRIISTYPPRKPHLCVASSQLREIREDIRELTYNDFLLVLNYVNDSNLSPDLKQELETEYFIRNRGKPKN